MSTPIINTEEELELILKHIRLPRPEIDYVGNTVAQKIMSNDEIILGIKNAYASIIDESINFFELKTKP